ncbi:hypothetical protein ACRROR_004682, partial [Escherichia coli]
GHEGNCDHKRTLKANIIPLIQLIGGITAESLPAPSLAGGGIKITVAKSNGLMPIFNCYLQLNK